MLEDNSILHVNDFVGKVLSLPVAVDSDNATATTTDGTSTTLLAQLGRNHSTKEGNNHMSSLPTDKTENEDVLPPSKRRRLVGKPIPLPAPVSATRSADADVTVSASQKKAKKKKVDNTAVAATSHTPVAAATSTTATQFSKQKKLPLHKYRLLRHGDQESLPNQATGTQDSDTSFQSHAMQVDDGHMFKKEEAGDDDDDNQRVVDVSSKYHQASTHSSSSRRRR